MKLVSVNVGLPREIIWKGKPVTTSIFKEPIEGKIRLRTLNLDGDQQADLSVHGGVSKAVYAYPAEHYGYWQKELPSVVFQWGKFGENFTTEGLREDSVGIGDRFRIGSAVVRVTEPRMPCYKLVIRFEMDDMVKRFMASERTGFYFAVVQEGEVEAGDEFEPLDSDENKVTVAGVTRLYVRDKDNVKMLRQMVELEALPESWKGYFRHRLENLEIGIE